MLCVFDQIAYDVSGAGLLFRETFGLTLGWWHCYKQANLILWRFAGPHFLWPMFHALIPRSAIRKTPKLVTIATFLSYVRLAYPRFRVQLAEAINNPAVTDNNKRHLINLKRLCEFFIPAVSEHHNWNSELIEQCQSVCLEMWLFILK